VSGLTGERGVDYGAHILRPNVPGRLARNLTQPGIEASPSWVLGSSPYGVRRPDETRIAARGQSQNLWRRLPREAPLRLAIARPSKAIPQYLRFS